MMPDGRGGQKEETEWSRLLLCRYYHSRGTALLAALNRDVHVAPLAKTNDGTRQKSVATEG